MSLELISIIIPVYNVEDYLEECVKSCQNQTYSNLEIMLVDDGSTDKSGDICKKLAAQDQRIVVYTKENGGLSDARNYGTKRFKGDYFTYIDSDDIIPENYVQELYDALKKEGTTLGMCDFVRMENGVVFDGSLQLNGRYTSPEVVKSCFKGQLAHSACAKLFAKELAGEIDFPKDRYFEDEFAIYDVLLKHDAAVTNQTKYIYRKRPGSITQGAKVDKRNQDLFDALEHVEKVTRETNPEIAYALDFKILQDCMVIIKNDIKLRRKTEISNKAVKKIKGLSQENLQKMETGRSFYVQYKLIKNCYPIYRIIFYLMYRFGLNTEA